MCALDGLHVEVEGSGFGVCADGGIAGVCERAGLPIAETGDIVFVATEVLLFRSPSRIRLERLEGCEGNYLSLNEQNCWLITCQTISSEDMVVSENPVQLVRVGFICDRY